MADTLKSLVDPSVQTQLDNLIVSLQQTIDLLGKANAIPLGSNKRFGNLSDYNKELEQQILINDKIAISNNKVQQSLLQIETQKAKLDVINQRSIQTSLKSAKAIADEENEYKKLSKAYNEAALKAKNLQISAPGSEETKQAIIDANLLGDKLKELDASVGQHQRNVGNYSSALTGYAMTLRGLRGPTKLLGEALGIGAQAADQLRLVIEHSMQGLAAYFRGKENAAKAAKANATATEAEAVATTENTVATEANAVAETEVTVAKERGVLATIALGAWNSVLTFVYGAEAVAAATAAEATGALYAVMSGGILLVIGLIIGGIVKLVSVISDWVHAEAIAAEKAEKLAEANKAVIETLKEREAIYKSNQQTVKKALEEELAAASAAGKSQYELLTIKKKIAEEDIKNSKGAIDRNNVTVKSVNELKNQWLSATATLLSYQEQVKGIAKLTEDDEKILKSAKSVADAAKAAYEFQNSLLEEQKKANEDNALNSIEVAKLSAEEQRKFALQVAQQKAEAVIQANEIILSNEASTQQQRLAATRAISAENIAIIKAELNARLQDPSLTPQGKIAEESAANAAIQKVRIEGNQKLLKIDEDYRKRELEAEYNLRVGLLNTQKSVDDEILKSEASTLADKIQALSNEIRLEGQLETERYNQAKAKQGLTAKELEVLENDHNIKMVEIAAKGEKDALKIKDDAAQKQIDAAKALHDGLIKARQDENGLDATAATSAEAQAMDELNRQYLNGAINAEAYAEAKKKLENENTIANIKAQIDAENKLALAYDAGSKERLASLSKVSTLEKQLSDAQVKQQDEHIKEETDKRNKKIDAAVNYEQKGADIVKSIVDGEFEARKNAIQKQIDLISQRQEADVAAVNASTLNQQQKAAQLLIIEQTAAAQKQKLQRDQRNEEIRKAKFDKEQAIFQATITLIADVIKNGILTPNGIATQIAGLALIAELVAKPIPQYAKGTDFAPGGLAIVGEKGAELITTPSGETSLTPSKPTLINLQRGSKVTPHHKLNEIALNDYIMQKHLNVGLSTPQRIETNFSDDRIVQVLQDVKQAIKSIKQAPPVIHIDSGWGAYIDKNVRN